MNFLRLESKLRPVEELTAEEVRKEKAAWAHLPPDETSGADDLRVTTRLRRTEKSIRDRIFHPLDESRKELRGAIGGMFLVVREAVSLLRGDTFEQRYKPKLVTWPDLVAGDEWGKAVFKNQAHLYFMGDSIDFSQKIDGHNAAWYAFAAFRPEFCDRTNYNLRMSFLSGELIATGDGDVHEEASEVTSGTPVMFFRGTMTGKSPTILAQGLLIGISQYKAYVLHGPYSPEKRIIEVDLQDSEVNARRI